jgi:replication factor C subunit 3/5
MMEICDNEGIRISEKGIEAVFSLCQGDMRRVVNMLQSLSMTDNQC